MSLDLALLPSPEIIETIDTEAIISALTADVTERFLTAGVSYDVGGLEVDPVKIVLEVAAARETVLRARINDAAKANLVIFAAGSDLDHLAGFYDVERLPNEIDTALRNRTILAIRARSPGGSEFWYEAAARRADTRIRDVAVYREAFLPIIHVAVLSSLDGGIPDQAMLAAVETEVKSDSVRLVNDAIVVEAAVGQTVNIEANVWLLPDAPYSVFEGLEALLRNAWNAETGIGFDLDLSWAQSRIHVPGVKRVVITSPSTAVVASNEKAIAIGTITLTYMGRAF
ncbi:baseplate J protein [Mesorhizobium sp. NBSH29]|uniref:baseplate J/gp47 family protein n=1 Tax=Mesorhizobium sp. NBSH29 TaxID=2654249 RepID=UPI0018967344|nr:baseplate J/gp47 family protein [Mesorhizobium sp. NBSH29]QPC87142.1 baseplate J protein [Mesorhizobium sp. NBSH29]